jgi:glycosyltransferase involved in cell wall biosynthesis
MTLPAPDLTIVIPCLNEEENIVLILDRLVGVLDGHGISTEIIVVDDQSDDRTFLAAEATAKRHADKLSIRVVRRPLHRRGYGAAVRWGVAHGTAKYCIFVSADGVDPVELIPDFYSRMEAGATLVQCSRYLVKSDAATIPFKYKFYQFFYRFGVRFALGHFIADSTYAFKMFRRIDLLGMGLKQNRFSISPEITFKTLLIGGRVEYVAAGQGTRQIGASKFYFRREAFGYGYVLLRAWLHRTGLAFWF